jgi:signal transduction histidine kinase
MLSDQRATRRLRDSTLIQRVERGGGVRVHWAAQASSLAVYVDDDGPGVADTANLFVPSFTTKDGGSGIGLVLARQIAQAHGGVVQLATRSDGSGARALVSLSMQR